MFTTFKRNLTDFSLFLKINLFVTTLVFFLFMSLNAHYDFLSFIFTIATIISTSATLYLIYYLVFLPFVYFKRSAFLVASFIFVFTNLALVVDFFIYRIWKFHINAMVLNILTSPAAFDSIQTGIMPIVTAVLVVVSFIAFEIYLYKKIVSAHDDNKNRLNSKINRRILPLIFIIILAEKMEDGFAMMYSKVKYLELTKVVPLYQPMDFTGFMEKTFGLKGETSKAQTLAIGAHKNIKYPLHPIVIKNPNPTNIFIFAFDATRASIMSPEVAPNVYKLMDNSTSYTNHISGGNATRFGIFSFMYGLNASYWFPFLNAQKGSILFNTLQKMDYNIHIFSSTETSWPEFKKTCYFNIQKNISDEHTGKVYEKDKQTVDEFLHWVDDSNVSQPMFSFVFLDSPHSNSYPKEYRKFLPDNYGSLNYLTVSKKDRTVLMNQYRNAIYYSDTLLAQMIKKLKEKGLYKKSIIIFTADHGQEFFEHGNFGHNSSYNYEQVKVPFVVHWPNGTKKVNAKLTSHLDMVPSVMRYIGVTNPPSDYSNGYPLQDANYTRDFAYIGNWNDNAILTNRYVHTFSNLPNRMFDNKTYDTKTYLYQCQNG